MNKILRNTTIIVVSALVVLASCEQAKKDIDPIAVIELVTGISTVGSPAGINFTTVNNITLDPATQVAFRLNVISPKSFQALEITKQVGDGTPQLIYLGVTGYDASPYYRNRVLGGLLSTTTSFVGNGRFPSTIPLIQTGLAFSSSYLTTSSGFVFQTGNTNGPVEKYNFKVTDNYGREASNYLNITINGNNNNPL